jgi:undecaprenyl-diphosphatase
VVGITAGRAGGVGGEPVGPLTVVHGVRPDAAGRAEEQDMGWLEALVLGIVQGLTEFLPISSSAHQSIVGQFFGGEDPGAAFTAITQLGTEAAVILYFRRDIVRIIRSWFLVLVGRIPRDDPDARMGWLVIIGSVPIVLLGLLFQDAIDSALRNLWITAAMLGGFGIVIGIADHLARNARPLESLTWGHGILFGLAQSLALIPGVSRSGATIAAGLALGYTREAAARYSFLLAIPAVVGSGLFKLADIGNDPVAPAWGPIVLATVIAFVIGYAVIAWLLRYISTHTFAPFVIYRIALALLVVVLLLTGVLEPLPQG